MRKLRSTTELAMLVAAAILVLTESIDQDMTKRLEPIDAPGCGLRPLLSDNGASEILGESQPRRRKRIVGGHETTPLSWPSICSLTVDDMHRCGGTLVKNNVGEFYLITAAHCVFDKLTQRKLHFTKVLANCGQHDRYGDTPSHLQTLTFSSITIHKRFGQRVRLDYDIAVLGFEHQPVENDYVRAACLPSEDNYDGEGSIAVGWGSLYSGAFFAPHKLRQVNIFIQSDAVCRREIVSRYGGYGGDYNQDNQMCAEYDDGGRGDCQGDSGGPLYTYRHGRWTLVGVVSHGDGCGKRAFPTKYADVYQLRNWIEKQVNGQSVSELSFSQDFLDKQHFQLKFPVGQHDEFCA